MKSNKMLALGALALASVASSFAADLGTVRITGATAFRASALTSIKNLFKTTGSGQLKYGWVGTGSFTSSTYSLFTGELVGTTDTLTVAATWAGSAGGVQNIVQTTTNGEIGGPAGVVLIPYLSNTGVLTTAGASGLATPTSSFVSHIAFSDVQAALTPFNRPSDKAVVEPANSPVGIIPFYWVVNEGANASITNMNHQLVKGLLSQGSLPLSFWTNNSADTSLVRVFGRDPDSGSRITTFEEAGFGAFSLATQWEPVPATGTGNITGASLYPAQTINGIVVGLGEGGYSSGGTLADHLGRTSSVGAFVGYLGRSDATRALNAGARLLSYNGVTAPVTTTAVPVTNAVMDAPFINGTYSFWSFEHMYYTDDASPLVQDIAAKLALDIHDNTASVAGLPVTSMLVTRGGEGQAVTP